MKLGLEALRQGNSQIVEAAYQKTRNLDKLSLLYLITGNMVKLYKMQQIAQNRNDKTRLFHCALVRGDIEKRVEMLAESGQVPLAYVLAQTHCLQQMLRPLEDSLGPQGTAKLQDYISKLPRTRALHPMVPIFTEKSGGDQNWPLHQVITSEYEVKKNQTDPANPYAMEPEAVELEENVFSMINAEVSGAWGEDIEFEEDNECWDVEDVEVPEAEDTDRTEGKSSLPGLTLQQKWAKTAEVPGELVAAGAFSAAMQLLTRTAGVTHFALLKTYFMEVYMAGQVSVPLMPHVKPIEHFLTKQKSVGTARPHVVVQFAQLTNSLKNAYKLTTQAKFTEALREFVDILHRTLFLSAASDKEEGEVKELVKLCTEYVTCMRLEIGRVKEIQNGNFARAVELGYYMSLCKLQPPHCSLTLRSAVAMSYKYKNFITCASLCRRFLELVANFPNTLPGNSQPVIEKHNKVLNYCKQNFTNDLAIGVELPENALDIVSVLCQRTFTQVSSAIPTSRCPYCFSLYHKEYKGSVCDNCLVAQVGLESLGLKIHS